MSTVPSLSCLFAETKCLGKPGLGLVVAPVLNARWAACYTQGQSTIHVGAKGTFSEIRNGAAVRLLAARVTSNSLAAVSNKPSRGRRGGIEIIMLLPGHPAAFAVHPAYLPASAARLNSATASAKTSSRSASSSRRFSSDMALRKRFVMAVDFLPNAASSVDLGSEDGRRGKRPPSTDLHSWSSSHACRTSCREVRGQIPKKQKASQYKCLHSTQQLKCLLHNLERGLTYRGLILSSRRPSATRLTGLCCSSQWSRSYQANRCGAFYRRPEPQRTRR